MPDLLPVPPLGAVVEALDAVVAERGEGYVYPDEWREGTYCLYVRPDGEGPACIAGAVYFRLGVSLDLLRGCEHNSALQVAEAAYGRIPEADDIGRFLMVAQGAQDRGESWGNARDEALAWARQWLGLV